VLSWSAIPGANSYDVIVGDLGSVLFSAGTEWHSHCQGNNVTSTSFALDVNWVYDNDLYILVRAVFPSATGTFDEGGNQVGSRDVYVTDCP
jgi:hypothetical protein